MRKWKGCSIAVGAAGIVVIGMYFLVSWLAPGLGLYLKLRGRAFFGDTEAMIELSALTWHNKWLELAAENGNHRAYFLLGNWNSRYPHKALAYYRKGAEIETKKREIPSCLCQLANAYQFGLYGLEKNEAEAKRLDAIAREIQLERRKKEGR